MQQPVQQPPYRTHQYGKPWVTATRVVAILLMVGGVVTCVLFLYHFIRVLL